ncbi:MAG: S41 family peptidase [Chloroflexota bacterium]
MGERRKPNPWLGLGTLVIAAVLVFSGFIAGAVSQRAGLLPGADLNPRPPTAVAPEFNVFWEAWNLATQNYVDKKAIDPTRMTYGAISGMLDSLGDTGHTRFLSPEQLKAEQEALSGRFEGIGAQIGDRDGKPTILAPLPGTPAEKAGVKAGDVIVRVDGKDVTGLTLQEVVLLVRGPAGTTVTLTVLRLGEANTTDIQVPRAQINVPSVYWAMLPGTRTAHIMIVEFADNATTDVANAVQAAQAQGATAFILDLRNNPGGLRDEAVGVASQFLRSGNALVEVDAQGNRKAFPVRQGGVALDVPLVVLVNEGTASSAEIVSGAIQDQKRATLVGTKTTGTGTVLSIYDLSDGSAIFLGTMGWLTPNGRQIWHQGIAPDVVVPLPLGVVPVLPQEESGMTPEQLTARNDAQLARAMELLKTPAPAR